MSIYSEAVDEIISHFLTEYKVDSRPQFLKEYVKIWLLRKYSPESALQIVDIFYEKIKSILLEEFNQRCKSKQLLRYDFLDENGAKIKGAGWRHGCSRVRIFQDALNGVSDNEFERLSAIVLGWMGCRHAWVTPGSHDQGLDAFGYSFDLERYLSKRICCSIVMLAQAKHYNKTKVGTKDIREFVGSAELAVHQIFSDVDTKYSDLKIKPFGPCVLVFLTTQEVPTTVKRLATKTGIVVLTAEDIYDMFQKKRVMRRATWSRRNIMRKIKELIENVAVAN